jgi:hypothetical protein
MVVFDFDVEDNGDARGGGDRGAPLGERADCVRALQGAGVCEMCGCRSGKGENAQRKKSLDAEMENNNTLLYLLR